MARAVLSTIANEGSTYVIRAAYFDEDDSAVTPDSVTWTLTNGNGVVINSREDVTIVTPSTYNDVVLGAADLRCSGTRDETRVIIVKFVYDSSTVTDAPGVGQVEFTVQNIQNVAGT